MSDETKAQKKGQQNPRRDESIEVQTRAGTVNCVLPGIYEWDLWFMKIKKGELAAGRRELVNLCATTDLAEVKRVVARFPALPKKFVDRMAELVGDSMLPSSIDEDSVTFTVAGTAYKFGAPAQEDWEEIDAQMNDRRIDAGPAMRAFVSKCFQGTVDLQPLFAAYPGVVGPILKQLGDLAGGDFEVVSKKGARSTEGQSEAKTSQPAA